MITNINMTVGEATDKVKQYLPGCMILDVGGGMRPLPYATHVIDILRYDQRCWYGSIGDIPHEEFKFSEATWLATDICNIPWPYEDKQFDVVWCTQTIEDIRDPIGVIKEISRVGKRGYISSVHRSYESQLNVDNDKNYAGYVHHRWLVEIESDNIVFTFKYPLLHTLDKYRPKWIQQQFLGLWWENSISAYETHLMSMQAIEDNLTNYADKQNKKASL